MEDKNMLNDDELNEVAGGVLPAGVDSYIASVETVCVFCNECGNTVEALKAYDANRNMYKYICLTNRSHTWYEEK